MKSAKVPAMKPAAESGLKPNRAMTMTQGQIAIRLPESLLDAVDAIITERHGVPDRTAVIRELLASAIARRKPGK